MLFTSVQFVFFFLPIVMGTYWALRGDRARNLWLLAASVLFYFWGEQFRIAALLLTVAISYGFGARLARSKRQKGKKRILIAGVALQLALLVGLKYLGFIGTTVNQLLTLLATGIQMPVLTTRLPLGVSFFVFHGISYLVDSYRGHIKPERRFSVVSLYFFLFPHQVAGPIVRYKTFAENADDRKIREDDLAYGIERFIQGLAKKVLIANLVAQGADAVFALPVDDLSTPLAWLGAVCYTLQIYFDFSGYSDMAIGLARMFGFHFHENFNFPYKATSVTDFWRRWHISLSSWFRDYVYIPLGGNRASKVRTYCNLVIVFLLCGLWHGANWTFLIWGAWHGLFLVIERMGFEAVISKHRLTARIWTMLVAVLGWVIFRAESLGQAGMFFRQMFSLQWERGDSAYQTHLIVQPLLAIGIALGVLFATGDAGRWVRERMADKRWPVYATLLMAAFVLSMSRVAGSTFNPFIYFRF